MSSKDGSEQEPVSKKLYLLNGCVLFCVVIVGPSICRLGDLGPPDRCLVIICSVLVLQICHVIPLYCTALFIPVLGTICAVFGKQMNMMNTSTVLIGNVFNKISFLVLGALVISSVVSKCELERRFVKKLVAVVGSVDSACFLLSLMIGTMVLSSVLFSGSVLMLAAIRPLAASSTCSPVIAKRLILGIGFAANIGSMWFPISSPLNLITLSILKQFEHSVEFTEWCIISIPVACVVMLFTWLILIILYREPEGIVMLADTPPESADRDVGTSELTTSQKLSVLLGVLTTILISVFPRPFNSLLGHPAILALTFVVIIFGSGFLSREEFKELDWDLLALVGGTNVMAFLTRETGLAEVLTTRLIESDVPFGAMQFWMLLAILLFVSMVCATLLSHQLTGVVLVPIVCAIGVRFQSAELVVILCALAIPCSMGLPHVSFDNLAAMTTSLALPQDTNPTHNKGLKPRDFHGAGNFVTFIAFIVMLCMGYPIGVSVYGPAAPMAISQDPGYTPKELKPSEGPKQVQEVQWSEQTPDWQAFLKKPDHKAFAVGKMEKNQKTRAWGAAWGHASQEAANKDALGSCGKVAKSCRIVYPPSERKDKEGIPPPPAAQKKEAPAESKIEKEKDPKFSILPVSHLQANVRGYDRRAKMRISKSQMSELASKT